MYIYRQFHLFVCQFDDYYLDIYSFPWINSQLISMLLNQNATYFSTGMCSIIYKIYYTAYFIVNNILYNFIHY